MNEDDTFNRLRRIPYNEILDKLITFGSTHTDEVSKTWTEPFKEKEIELVSLYGWSELDFKKELYRTASWADVCIDEINQELDRLENNYD